MNEHDLPSDWAQRFGLALTPLFEEEETVVEGSHHVLLDGGYGSFALSVSADRIWKNRSPASWSWSCNLPHHVTVTENEIAVVRWDNPRAELLTRSSVESQIETFYKYLSSDRIKTSQRVVDHILMAFRRIRSLVADARIDDQNSIDAFLAFLAMAIKRSREEVLAVDNNDIANFIMPEGANLLGDLSRTAVDALYEDAFSGSSASIQLKLFPDLAVRHAGSEIFQEAHFELLRAPSPDLFGYAAPAEVRQVTRGGAHFTPPALARSIAEQAFSQIRDLGEKESLVILDPACGSGAFLHEALRTLRRFSFAGSVRLIGRDMSRAAISMAAFVLNAARADWSPAGGCTVDVSVGDSLAEPLPAADVVLMNPPFIAWPALSQLQRDQMSAVLGKRLSGRGDFSMAFVTHAVDALTPGGVVGTLLPASLLTLRAAESWRGDLLERTDLRFVASLGDYNIFSYALVQISALILKKPPEDGRQSDIATALLTSNSSDATGNALRALRRSKYLDFHTAAATDDKWHLFQISIESLKRKPTWRLVPPRAQAAIERLFEVGQAVQIGELFDVRQGVRTGMNAAFVITDRQFGALPAREQRWFRPAIMNDSIENGEICSPYRIFYPYNQTGILIRTEDELRKKLPNYYENYLLPVQNNLAGRTSIADQAIWWSLSERRAWALDPKPRLVSKYFGGPGGFATDVNAEFVVVQGFAWISKWTGNDEVEIEQATLSTHDTLSAYMAIMNSLYFSKLLETFAPHVAGGQFDLSPRYVNAIPVPNLRALASNERAGRTIVELAALGRHPRVREVEWRNTVNRLTSDLYGGDILNEV